ncbi:MAG: hypothetical protein M3N41_08590 [Acidobacteriota bacterium]|nr:hypothetical protein [Acidobacteriota bacterium]
MFPPLTSEVRSLYADGKGLRDGANYAKYSCVADRRPNDAIAIFVAGTRIVKILFLDVTLCYSSGMAADEINSRLRAIVEKLKANLPVAGLVDVVAEEIRSLSLKDNVRKISMSDWAGERRANTDLYLVVDELEKVSSDPRNAVAHAESAMRYWETANNGST